MIRRTTKWSFRLGLLVVVAIVVKKLLDSQRQAEPVTIKPVVPPTPKPKPEPKPEPIAEISAIAEPPADPPKPEPVKKAAPAKRTEPLKASREAKKALKPVKANRKAPAKAAEAPAAMLSWVEPVGTVCPTSHPIKVKLGSRVFRRPEMPSYENSKPDRCYASEGAARRAGFNEAQR